MKLKKAYVLSKDYNFFGVKIPKGTVYKEQEKNKDWFTPTIIEKGNIPMLCPSYMLHFTVFLNDKLLFIEIFI